MAEALTVDSDFDWITSSALDYRRQVLDDLATKNHTIRSLVGVAATTPFVNAAMQDTFELFTGAGHGSRRGDFTGQGYAPILSIELGPPETVALERLKGKIVHLLSCWTGGALGPELVRRGCTAFFGYSGRFWVERAYADRFWAVDSLIVELLLRGLRAREVVDRVEQAFEDAVDAFTVDGDAYSASLMLANRNVFVGPKRDNPGLFGDERARV